MLPSTPILLHQSVLSIPLCRSRTRCCDPTPFIFKLWSPVPVSNRIFHVKDAIVQRWLLALSTFLLSLNQISNELVDFSNKTTSIVIFTIQQHDTGRLCPSVAHPCLTASRCADLPAKILHLYQRVPYVNKVCGGDFAMVSARE